MTRERLVVPYEFLYEEEKAIYDDGWHSRDAEVDMLEDDIMRMQALGNERLAQLQEQLVAVQVQRDALVKAGTPLVNWLYAEGMGHVLRTELDRAIAAVRNNETNNH